MTTPVTNITRTNLNLLDPNLATNQIADPALRKACFDEIYNYFDTFVTAYNTFIANGGIGTANLADLSVTSAKIALLAVTAAQLADSSVTSAKIVDLTIATGDIADGAITSVKIADGTIVNADVNSAAAIDGSKLANLSITSSQIADGAIMNVDINASAAIDASKIGAGTVSNTEFGYLDGVTGPIQTQLTNATLGAIADGSITDIKLSNASTEIKQRYSKQVPMVYNANGYGAIGDGSDHTNEIQAAINAAVTANAKCLFFSTGTYSASSLTNLNKVVLLGDNATLSVGGNDVPINQLGGSLFNNSSTSLTKVINKMQNGLAVVIQCIGDSTTYGSNGAGGQTANPYPQTLQARLRTIYNNVNITVINSGVNGQQSDEGLANFDSVVIPNNPDLVIIMYGINDISGYVTPTNSISTFRADIQGIVSKCIGNGYRVLLLTPTFTQYDNTKNSNPLIEVYGEASIEIAKANSVPYIDMHKAQESLYLNGSTSPGGMMVDEAHFSNTMYQLMADIVLQQALDNNMGKSLNIKTSDTVNVPAVKSKYIKTDCTVVSSSTSQFNFNTYSFLLDGTRGTYLSFEFYISKAGMDLYLVSPLVNQGGKLAVIDNGVTLSNPINFYAEETTIWDGQNLVYENIPLGYHKLEFKIANLVSGDATLSPSNPAMYISYFQFRPTEATPNASDIYYANDAVHYPVVEKFIPVLGAAGGVRYDGANTYNNVILRSGRFAQLKNGKTFVLEFDGYLFDKFGVTWFGNKATSTSGYNTGYLLLFSTTTITLYNSGVNDAVQVFTNSSVTQTLDYTLTHRVRIEMTYAGVINVYIDGVLKITCTSTRFKGGFFGLYNQAVTSTSAKLSRFEYAYY